MQIKVTHVADDPFVSSNGGKLYTIHIEGEGSPQKTWNEELAKVGTHEAEKYQGKNGKDYWRVPKAAKPQRSFGKSIEERNDIKKMNALNNAVAFCSSPDVDVDYVLDIAQDFYEWLTGEYKQELGLDPQLRETLQRKANTTATVPQATYSAVEVDVDLPPIENYDEQPF